MMVEVKVEEIVDFEFRIGNNQSEIKNSQFAIPILFLP